ncbi:MAG: murein hydrolase activator EnvC family protein [Actinomycetota bacterium]
MLTGSPRAWLVATFLATLLVPSVGSVADPGDDLRATEQKLNVIRDKIEEGESEAQFLKRRVAALNENLTILQIQINKLDARITRIESDVRNAQARIDRTQAEIDRVQDLATEQAVALYKSGGTETLDALIGSRTLAELNQRLEFLGITAERNTGALIQYHRLRLAIQVEQAELFAKKKELSTVLAEQSRLHERRAEQRAQLAADLEKLNGRLASWRHREGSLEEVALRLTGDIQSAQAKAAVATLGESAQGFIWPLNGPVTSGFGERWGRMHTGIDIDGYTGQPIVASKAGQVIMSSYYSGYGNTVIVDHGGGYATLYAHMSDFATSSGKYVEQGKIVGYVGCTGSCTGDHLHFEVRINGNPVDPMKYLP